MEHRSRRFRARFRQISAEHQDICCRDTIRAADTGISVAIDPYGRIIGAVDHCEAEERVLVAQLPTHGVRTVYSIIGNVVPWLCVAGMVALIAWALIRGRRTVRGLKA